MNEPIQYAYTSGKELARIVSNVENVIKDEDDDSVVMACLSIAIMLLNPGIPPSKLVDGVKGASEWISMFLDDVPVDKSRMN